MISVFVAGARDSVLTEAVVEVLTQDRRVRLNGIEVERLDAARLREIAPDLLISAGHAHMIGARLRRVARLGAVGIHPSLLPAYRGSWPLWWALRNGEREVGVTLFHLVERVDAGPIIAQRRLRVGQRDTFASLYARVRPLVVDLVSELITAIDASGVVPSGSPQDEERAIYYRTPGLAARFILRVRLATRSMLPGPKHS